MFSDEMEYSNAISVTEDHVVVAGFLEGFARVYDRKTRKALKSYHNLSAPMDVLELSDGRIIVAQLMPGAIILLPEDVGGERETLAKGLAGPVSLAEAADGAIYVSESFGGRISRVDLATGERSDVITGLKGTEGIDVAPDGRIIVAEVGLQRIIAVDPDSGEVEVIAEDLPIGMKAPEGLPPVYIVTGVTVASDGTIYYASDLEDAVYRIKKKLVLR